MYDGIILMNWSTGTEDNEAIFKKTTYEKSSHPTLYTL